MSGVARCSEPGSQNIESRPVNFHRLRTGNDARDVRVDIRIPRSPISTLLTALLALELLLTLPLLPLLLLISLSNGRAHAASCIG